MGVYYAWLKEHKILTMSKGPLSHGVLEAQRLTGRQHLRKFSSLFYKILMSQYLRNIALIIGTNPWRGKINLQSNPKCNYLVIMTTFLSVHLRAISAFNEGGHLPETPEISPTLSLNKPFLNSTYENIL